MERRNNPLPRRYIVLAQLSALVLGALSGCAYSTQAFAAHTNYAPELGASLFHYGSTPVYSPWSYITWYMTFGETLPDAFWATKNGLAYGLIAGTLAAIGLKQLFQTDPLPTEHGSSRWATDQEIYDSGLPEDPTSRSGIVVGKLPNGDLLTHDGPEHALCFAPTRSGKGVGLVVPTLLTWTESVVVLDVKRENWDITSAWRSTFSHTLCFDPTSRNTACFNPLLEIRLGDKEVRDVRNLVEILCNPDSPSNQNSDDFWTESAKDLLTGVILHVLYAEADKSLAGVLRFIRHPDYDLEEKLEIMKSTEHKQGRPHPTVEQTAQALLTAPEKTRGSIVKTAERFLTIFDDPVVADATRTSDFRLSQLQNSDTPLSLYLAVPPSDMDRLQPLLRLLIIQLGNRLTEDLNDNARKNRLLLLLDEFPTLGGMEWFEKALAYFAGYDVRAMLFAQTLNQIKNAYGPDNAILDNCHLRIAFAANDDRTARRISDLLGDATAQKEQTSISGDRSSIVMERQSESESLYQRKLMTPGEVTQLPDDEEILMVAGHPPIRANKVRYYQNPHFKRLCPEWNDFSPVREKAADTPTDSPPNPWTAKSASTPIDLTKERNKNDFQSASSSPAPSQDAPSEDSPGDNNPSNENDSETPETSETSNTSSTDTPHPSDSEQDNSNVNSSSSDSSDRPGDVLLDNL